MHQQDAAAAVTAAAVTGTPACVRFVALHACPRLEWASVYVRLAWYKTSYDTTNERDKKAPPYACIQACMHACAYELTCFSISSRFFLSILDWVVTYPMLTGFGFYPESYRM